MINGAAKTKSALIECFREILGENPRTAKFALSVIYKKQTADEKESKDVKHHNGVGFRSCDAEFLSSLAERLNKTGDLSERQMKWLLKKMPVYAAQFVSIMLRETGQIKYDGSVYWW